LIIANLVIKYSGTKWYHLFLVSVIFLGSFRKVLQTNLTPQKRFIFLLNKYKTPKPLSFSCTELRKLGRVIHMHVPFKKT